MENIIDKSVLKRQWYMMGYRDAAIELLQAFNKKFVTYACVGDYWTEGEISEFIQELAKEHGVEIK